MKQEGCECPHCKTLLGQRWHIWSWRDFSSQHMTHSEFGTSIYSAQSVWIQHLETSGSFSFLCFHDSQGTQVGSQSFMQPPGRFSRRCHSVEHPAMICQLGICAPAKVAVDGTFKEKPPQFWPYLWPGWTLNWQQITWSYQSLQELSIFTTA